MILLHLLEYFWGHTYLGACGKALPILLCSMVQFTPPLSPACMLHTLHYCLCLLVVIVGLVIALTSPKTTNVNANGDRSATLVQ